MEHTSTTPRQQAEALYAETLAYYTPPARGPKPEDDAAYATYYATEKAA